MPLTLYPRGNYWWVRGTVRGRKVRQSTGIALGLEVEAQQFANNLEAELIKRSVFGDEVVSDFSEAVLDYLNSGGEGRFLKPIHAELGPTLLRDINQALLNKVANKLYPHAAPATVNRQFFTPVSAVLNHAAENGKWIPRRIKRRKVQQTIPDWIEPFEADPMIAAANPAFAFALELFFGSGGRAGEVLRLDFADVSLDSGHCLLRKTKNGRARSVRLPGRTLRAIHQLSHRSGRVVRSSTGQGYTVPEGRSAGAVIDGAFATAVKLAGIEGKKLTPHSTRHSWATWHWSATKDLVHVKRSGGWSDTATMEIYTHLALPETAGQVIAAGWCEKHKHPVTNEALADALAYQHGPRLKVIEGGRHDPT